MVKPADSNSTSPPDGVDSFFQNTGSNNSDGISLAEYLVWVEQATGVAVVQNSTTLNMWIEKFERFVQSF